MLLCLAHVFNPLVVVELSDEQKGDNGGEEIP